VVAAVLLPLALLSPHGLLRGLRRRRRLDRLGDLCVRQQCGSGRVASEPFAWLRAFPNALSSTRHTLGEVAAAVPALWIYVGAAVIASLYGILGAIGATTYRVLSTTRATP